RLRGITDQLEPPPIFEGDIYQAREVPQASRALKEAIHVFENSNFVREAFGEDVVNHYLNSYRLEQSAFEKRVTDWERRRYFEQIWILSFFISSFNHFSSKFFLYFQIAIYTLK
ncbi:unnamed protein product, partial [Rotaria sp. Silwood2]